MKNKIFPVKFNDFWLNFPRGRRGNKNKAFIAWARAVKRAKTEEIYHGCIAYAKSAEGRGQFVKGCAAWLNDERWEIDYNNQSNTRGGGGVERVCVASTIRDIQHEIKLEQRLRQDISNKNDGENTR